jgi:hypothetical protein
MTGKTLKNLYPRLRPHERFRLVVEAVARGDKDEVGLLSGSCPRYTYRAHDVAYMSRVRAASRVALTAATRLLHAQIELAPAAFVREVLADERATMEAAGGDWSEIVHEDERRELEDLYRGKVAIVLGVCDGFERFCAAHGVQAAKLLAFAGCLPEWQSAVRLRGTEIASDPETAEAVHRFLQGLWLDLLQDE